jgi:hypothetical protein
VEKKLGMRKAANGRIGEGAGRGRGRREDVHHGPPYVLGGYHAFLLAVHGLGEQREGLLDLALLARRDVVLLGELRLPLLGKGVLG